MKDGTLITLGLFLIGLLFSVKDIGGIVSLSTDGFSLTAKAGVALIFFATYYYYHGSTRRKTRNY